VSLDPFLKQQQWIRCFAYSGEKPSTYSMEKKDWLGLTTKKAPQLYPPGMMAHWYSQGPQKKKGQGSNPTGERKPTFVGQLCHWALCHWALCHWTGLGVANSLSVSQVCSCSRFKLQRRTKENKLGLMMNPLVTQVYNSSSKLKYFESMVKTT
jgi:hypothetical protein